MPTFDRLIEAMQRHGSREILLASGEKLSKQTGAAALPADPLPSLLRAWRFLGQPEPPDALTSTPEFWQWAKAQWTPLMLPPMAMLPVPATGALAV